MFLRNNWIPKIGEKGISISEFFNNLQEAVSLKYLLRVLPVKVLTVLTTCMRRCHIQVFVTHTQKMLPVSEIDRLYETLLSHT